MNTAADTCNSTIRCRICELLDTDCNARTRLASHLQIDPNVITNWRAGRSTSYMMYLPTIAEFFNVSLDWLGGLSAIKSVNRFDKDTLAVRVFDLISELYRPDIEAMLLFGEALAKKSRVS